MFVRSALVGVGLLFAFLVAPPGGGRLVADEKEGGKLKFELYEDKKKEYRWRLKAANGQTIASSSEGYKDKADCTKAIDLIKSGAGKAEVAD